METKTKHSATCNMAFGRKDPNCPRCQELIVGAAPRKAWFTARNDDAQRSREIKAHNCQARGCGPVCTFGDW